MFKDYEKESISMFSIKYFFYLNYKKWDLNVIYDLIKYSKALILP